MKIYWLIVTIWTKGAQNRIRIGLGSIWSDCRLFRLIKKSSECNPNLNLIKSDPNIFGSDWIKKNILNRIWMCSNKSDDSISLGSCNTKLKSHIKKEKKIQQASKWTKERQNESVFILTSIILLRSSVTIASRKQES